MGTTKIEWTRADDGTRGKTWNPIVGCERVSPGCDNCYAARDSAGRLSHTPAYAGLTRRNEAGVAEFTGEIRLLPERFDAPLRWQKPCRVFVNSMSDLFHPDAPVNFIAHVFGVMAAAPRHTFQVLTKRPQRMAEVVPAICDQSFSEYGSRLDCSIRKMWSEGIPVPGDMSYRWPLPNVWLGTSIESDRYTFRADHLRKTPASIRFVSAEPLLGPLPSLDLTGIDWLIAGGESGPQARPMHPDWVRDLRDRCVEAGVAFFLKQWGEWGPGHPGVRRRMSTHPTPQPYQRSGLLDRNSEWHSTNELNTFRLPDGGNRWLASARRQPGESLMVVFGRVPTGFLAVGECHTPELESFR